MHDLEFDHMHVAPGDEVNEVAWAADNVELTTVGIDIGSSTSHLMFARCTCSGSAPRCRAASWWSTARSSGSRRSC